MIKDLFVDIETLGTKQDSVILSLGMIAVNLSEEFGYDDIEKFFIKFDAKDQKERLGRKVYKDTVEWWKKQDKKVQESQLKAYNTDVSLEEGLTQAAAWMKNVEGYHSKDSWVWTRGLMESFLLEHACEQVGRSPLFPFNKVRDVRTAVDILTGTRNGYIETTMDTSNLDKHDPVNDVILDAFMLRYPKEE